MKYCCLLLLFLFFAMPVFADVDNAELLPTKTSETSQSATANSATEEPAWGLTVAMLLVGGFLFMFLEIAVIPGFGITGVLGMLLLCGGLATAFLKLSMAMAMVTTFLAILGVVLLLLWFFLVFPKTSMGRQFILETESSAANGFVAVDDKSAYIGKTGITLTMLRPSGIAKIDDERVDVMTDGEFVEKGVKIKVIKTRQGGMIVTPIEDEPANPS